MLKYQIKLISLHKIFLIRTVLVTINNNAYYKQVYMSYYCIFKKKYLLEFSILTVL